MQTNNKPNHSFIAALISFLAIGGLGFYFTKLDKEPTVTTPQTEPTLNKDEAKIVMTKNGSEYKNGTYTVDGNYTSPGGEEQIGVSITLENNVITSATVTPKATRPGSVKFQGLFTENFRQFVIGKNIEDVMLDHVAGSSLTPKGFNDAVQKVKEAAKA
jgi:uncharacterized protein with FMN-binding domain